MKSIGVIGMGNMGNHLTKLFIKNNLKEFVMTSYPKHGKKFKTFDLYFADNETVIKSSDIIFLTVKPNQIKTICEEIKEYGTDMSNPKTIVSCAAGVSIEKIKEWTKSESNVVRFMPNIPISLGVGSIAWYTDDHIDSTKNILNTIFQGPSNIWLKNEKNIDSVTVLSGCGPAYVAKLYKVYQYIGKDLELNDYEINNLLKGMFLGTGKLLDEKTWEEIINEVASKGGATEKALKNLDEQNFESIIKKSVYSSLIHVENISKTLD